MKLTPHDSIKESEKEFIDTINAELDWEAIENLIKERHNFTIQDEVEYKNGDLTVHENQIAYKFEFELKVPITMICDRQGECISISSIREDENTSDKIQENTSNNNIEAPVPRDANINPEEQKKKTEQMASDIAQKINDINQEDDNL